MNKTVLTMAEQAELKCYQRFREIDRIALENTAKVLEAFRKNRVSEACFAGTTGYGYDDLGRETLDRIYAEIMGTEAALVRIGFVNGTHALTAALFALAGPGQTLLSVTGTPYDTLQEAIGIRGSNFGSLKYYGIGYRQVELAEDGGPDYKAIVNACKTENTAAVLIQRSRGYADRKALSISEIEEITKAVHSVRPNVFVMVDYCYGEFTDLQEPGAV